MHRRDVGRADRIAATILLAALASRGERAAGKLARHPRFAALGIAPPDGRPGWRAYLERKLRGEFLIAGLDDDGRLVDPEIVKVGAQLAYRQSLRPVRHHLPRRRSTCTRPRARRAAHRGVTRGGPGADEPGGSDPEPAPSEAIGGVG